jgi:hypothetical protein
LAGEAVAGQAVHGGPLADEDAAAVLAANQALVLQDVDGLAGGHAGHVIQFGKLGLAGEGRALGVATLADAGSEVVGDLPIDGPVAARVDQTWHRVAPLDKSRRSLLVRSRPTKSR